MSFIEKLRGPKIFKMATFDWAATVIGILIIVALTNINFWVASAGVVVTAVIVHKWLEVDTQFGYYLGVNPHLR